MEIQNTSDYYSTDYTPAKKELGTDEFFKILAAQLQYQDPLSGGDNTEYVAQMAQFAALEQMQNLNNSFNQMMIRQDLILGGDLIGKEVAIYDGSDELVHGVVEGYMITKNGLLFSVNDKEYAFSQIVAVKQKTEPEEVEEANETQEVDETPEAEASEETPETEETDGTSDTEDSGETPATEKSEETPQAEGTGETPVTKESGETEESNETPDEQSDTGEGQIT